MTVKKILFLCLAVPCFSIAKAQADSLKQYYFKEIGWRISLPARLEMMDEAARERLNKKGTNSLLAGNGLDTSIQIAKYQNLIAIRPDMLNYMGAEIKATDKKIDAGWNNLQQTLSEMITKSFEAKKTKVDTLTTWERVSGVKFRCFTAGIHMGSDILVMKMYATILNGYDAGITFCYMNGYETLGKQLLGYFKASRFETIRQQNSKHSKAINAD